VTLPPPSVAGETAGTGTPSGTDGAGVAIRGQATTTAIAATPARARAALPQRIRVPSLMAGRGFGAPRFAPSLLAWRAA
jgi:hypothetical protein